MSKFRRFSDEEFSERVENVQFRISKDDKHADLKLLVCYIVSLEEQIEILKWDIKVLKQKCI